MTIEFYIFELVYIPNFSFSNFDFFKQICYKKQWGNITTEFFIFELD